MHQSPFPETRDSFSAGRFVALAIVGILLLSAVGSSGIAAAQQGGNNTSSADNSTKTKVSAKQATDKAIVQFKKNNVGYKDLSKGQQNRVRKHIRKSIRTNNTKKQLKKIIPIFKRGVKKGEKTAPFTKKDRKKVQTILSLSFIETSTSSNVTTNGSAIRAADKAIVQFKKHNVGYKYLSKKQQNKVRTHLKRAVMTNNTKKQLKKIIPIFKRGVKKGEKTAPFTKKDRKKVQTIISTSLIATAHENVAKQPPKPKLPNLDINIPSLTGQKLRSIGHQMLTGAASFLKEVYDFAFSTPVPKNSGWKNILGEPTNKPFKPLYKKLLNGTLYPVTNMLLGIAVTLMGLSLTVNPLMSRFRAWNLITKFVTFLFLYGFAWTAITLMHGSVHSITMWIRPSAGAMGQLVTNVGKMSGIAIGAYFVGSGGIMAAAAGLATELAMRNVLLKYFFPYIFAPLVFILYVSPWERLKSVASMALWQYVNVLTMVIPMAVFLKAATIVKFSTEETLQGMILLIALYGAAAVMPFITTWAFAKMKGKAVAGAKSAAAGAASRAGAMKDSVRDSGSSSDSTATGGMSPGDRAEAAVETTSAGSSSGLSGVPSSGELSDSALEQTGPEGSETATTTAGQVRALHEEQQSSPNSADAKYKAYFKEQDERSGPRRTTMQEKLAD